MTSNEPDRLHLEDSLIPESVWDYPRPPVVEDVPQTVKIIFNDEVIVESKSAKRVLETSHPPVYYIPLEDIKSGILKPASRKTWCEWKGQASYYDIESGEIKETSAAWYYPKPNPGFEEVKDYVAFYASKMEACFVGEEQVIPQEGDFYGGWITSNLSGPFK